MAGGGGGGAPGKSEEPQPHPPKDQLPNVSYCITSPPPLRFKGYGPVHSSARWFNDMINVPFSSKAFVGGMLAYLLDLTLHKKDSAVRKDRGKNWWDKFRSFKGDIRSEEFYSLPFNLNKYFPSV